MTALYRHLLLLYPAWYREQFASEMTQVFDQAAQDRRSQSLPSYAVFLVFELSGLLRGSVCARSTSLFHSKRSALFLSIAAGAVVTLATSGFIFTSISLSIRGARRFEYSDAEKFTLLVMISICCVLLTVLLIAFFWMTERSLRARSARRFENLHRHSRGSGRQLRRAAR